MLEIFLYFKYIFRFFQINKKKTVFWDVPIHLDNFYTSYNFLGVFSDPEIFIFLVALSKKKYAPSEVFSHKISPNWLIRQAETTVPDGPDGPDGTDGPDVPDGPDGSEGPNGLDDRTVIYLWRRQWLSKGATNKLLVWRQNLPSPIIIK